MKEHLTTRELAERWGVHIRTLKRWRVKSEGPSYVKLGKGSHASILYKIKDIEDFETKSTVKPDETRGRA